MPLTKDLYRRMSAKDWSDGNEHPLFTALRIGYCYVNCAERWPRIRSAGVVTSRILRFPFGIGAGVKILWKTGLKSKVTFHFQQQESVWFSYTVWLFLSKYIAGFPLHRCPASEQESDSQIWKVLGPGSGFKNFRTGTEEESENMTMATSSLQKGPEFEKT